MKQVQSVRDAGKWTLRNRHYRISGVSNKVVKFEDTAEESFLFVIFISYCTMFQ